MLPTRNRHTFKRDTRRKRKQSAEPPNADISPTYGFEFDHLPHSVIGWWDLVVVVRPHGIPRDAEGCDLDVHERGLEESARLGFPLILGHGKRAKEIVSYPQKNER